MQTLAGRIKQKQRQRKEIIQETVIWKVIFCVLFVVVPSATTSQKETTVIFFTVGVNMFILNGTLLSPLRQTRKCPLGAWEIVAYPLWHLFWSGNDHLGMHDKNATFSVYSYICSMCANFIHGFLPQTKKNPESSICKNKIFKQIHQMLTRFHVPYLCDLNWVSSKWDPGKINFPVFNFIIKKPHPEVLNLVPHHDGWFSASRPRWLRQLPPFFNRTKYEIFLSALRRNQIPQKCHCIEEIHFKKQRFLKIVLSRNRFGMFWSNCMLFPNVVSMSKCDQTKYWWVSFVTTCAYRMFSCSCVLCLQCTVGFKFDSKWVANINRGQTFVHLVICFLQCFPNHPFHPNHMGTKQTKANRPIDIKNSQRIQFQLLGFHIAATKHCALRWYWCEMPNEVNVSTSEPGGLWRLFHPSCPMKKYPRQLKERQAGDSTDAILVSLPWNWKSPRNLCPWIQRA